MYGKPGLKGLRPGEFPPAEHLIREASTVLRNARPWPKGNSYDKHTHETMRDAVAGQSLSRAGGCSKSTPPTPVSFFVIRVIVFLERIKRVEHQTGPS